MSPATLPLALALVLAPALLACGRTPPAPSPQPVPSGTSAPSATATPAATPAPTPSSAPTVSPVPVATPTPVATATPTAVPSYRFVYTPPPGPTAAPGAPKIVEIDFTDQTIHQNSDVTLRILTSSVVASVVVSALGHDAPVPQMAPGMWGTAMHVPSVPFFFLNRTYRVEVRATTPDGRSDSVSLPVRLVR